MKNFQLMTFIIITVMVFVGCKESRKPIKITSNGDIKKSSKSKDYYHKLTGFITPEELGDKIVSIFNNYKTDGFKPLLDHVYFSSQLKYDRGEQILEYYSNIVDALLQRMIEDNTSNDEEFKLDNIEINGDKGQILICKRKPFLIKKIDGLWFIDEYSEMFEQIHDENFDKIMQLMKKMMKGKPSIAKRVKPTTGKWAEAKKTIVQLRFIIGIHFLVIAQEKGGLSAVSELKDMLVDGFTKDSRFVKEVEIDDSVFDSLQYFDREDFSIEFANGGTDGHFIIRVDASKGKGGLTGKGPKEGTGSYNSSTNKYSGMLK